MTDKPICSILMTTHNSAAFIKHTLHSIFWQTFSHFELLIVDNTSSDDTVSIISDIANHDDRIHLHLSDKNLGAFGGLNFLLTKATGKYVAIIDHDDIRHPDKLSKQIAFMEQHPNYVGCGSTFLDVREGDNFGKFELFTVKNVVMHSSLLFRNDGYRYNDKLYKYSDRDFMVHVLQPHGDIYHDAQVLILRRIRRGGRNVSVKWANFKGILHSQENLGVSWYELVYNIIRFRYKWLYRLLICICMPWKITRLTTFVSTNKLRKSYTDFVLQAFA